MRLDWRKSVPLAPLPRQSDWPSGPLKPLPVETNLMRLLPCIAALLLAGCATTLIRATPHRADGQDEVFKNGLPILSSRGAQTDVAVSPKGGPTGRYELGSRVPFFVFIRNRSDGRLLVSEQNIRVEAWGVRSKIVQPATVLSATQVENEVRSDAAWAQGVTAFASVAGAMALSDAGTTHQTAQVGGPAGLIVTGTSNNSGAAYQTQRLVLVDGANASTRIAAAESNSLNRVSQLIQRNTLEPGEAMSGGILIQRPDLLGCRSDDSFIKCKLQISVELGSDKHTFTFTEGD